MEWTEEARKTPVVGNYDVLVAGGGIAGVSAALAAARMGKSVCIVEAAAALGGLATLGMIVIYMPLCDGKGHQLASGIAEELFRAAYRWGPDHYPHHWPEGGRLEAAYDAAPMMLSLEELILEAGVQIRYECRVCALHVEGDEIRGVITESKAGRQGIAAKMIVDATGDADLCRMAGEKVGKSQGNVAAGWYMAKQEKNLQLITKTRKKWSVQPEKLADAHELEELETEERLYAPEEGTEILLRERYQVRRHAKDRLAKGDYPALIGLLPQVLKTYRLDNGFFLSKADEGKDFPDSIGRIGDWREAGPVYSLPYRMLPAGKMKNLITAGRCIAVADDLWDVTRVIPACAVTGQAAGVACALALDTGKNLQTVDVQALRRELCSQGALIPE